MVTLLLTILGTRNVLSQIPLYHIHMSVTGNTQFTLIWSPGSALC
jgi:hypothetical protein